MSHHDKAKDKTGPEGIQARAVPEAEQDTEGHRMPDGKPDEVFAKNAIPDEDDDKPGPEGVHA
jgi:hypothetical protein